MRFFVALLLTALLSFVACLWLDWWLIAVIAFLVALLVRQRPWKAFLAGFLGLFLLWGVLAEWIDLENGSILSGRIAVLLPVPDSSFLLVIITGIVGGLVAGLAALSGSYLRSNKIITE